jgi:hypothetical protein
LFFFDGRGEAQAIVEEDRPRKERKDTEMECRPDPIRLDVTPCRTALSTPCIPSVFSVLSVVKSSSFLSGCSRKAAKPQKGREKPFAEERRRWTNAWRLAHVAANSHRWRPRNQANGQSDCTEKNNFQNSMRNRGVARSDRSRKPIQPARRNKIRGADAAQDGAATALNRISSRRRKPFESNELRYPTALAALGRWIAGLSAPRRWDDETLVFTAWI